MFKAPEAPDEAVQNFYRAFNQYIYEGKWKL